MRYTVIGILVAASSRIAVSRKLHALLLLAVWAVVTLTSLPQPLMGNDRPARSRSPDARAFASATEESNAE
jgi:hypothetical protein